MNRHWLFRFFAVPPRKKRKYLVYERTVIKSQYTGPLLYLKTPFLHFPSSGKAMVYALAVKKRRMSSNYACNHVFQSLADSHASFFLKPSGRVATFSLKSFSASAQTLAVFLSFSCSKLSSRPALKDSEASRGSREGRWSMLRRISFKSWLFAECTYEMTERGTSFLSSLTSTGTVGLSKVVLIV